MGLSRNRIKHYRSLHRIKGRQEAGQFLVEGSLLVQEALKEGWPLHEVVITGDFAGQPEGKKILNDLETARIRCDFCSPTEMSRLADTVTPMGIIALARLPISKPQREKPSEILLVCECISDPGNLGTILRTAGWFGVGQVILGEGSADPFGPKVVRASAGAIFRVSVKTSPDLEAMLSEQQKKGRQLFAATVKGILSPQELPRRDRRGLVMGHEKRGISAGIEALCQNTVRIPGSGRAESLNLAVATGILLYCLAHRS